MQERYMIKKPREVIEMLRNNEDEHDDTTKNSKKELTIMFGNLSKPVFLPFGVQMQQLTDKEKEKGVDQRYLFVSMDKETHPDHVELVNEWKARDVNILMKESADNDHTMLAMKIETEGRHAVNVLKIIKLELLPNGKKRYYRAPAHIDEIACESAYGHVFATQIGPFSVENKSCFAFLVTDITFYDPAIFSIEEGSILRKGNSSRNKDGDEDLNKDMANLSINK